jgi:DNA-binding transcriptional ArsR family regulator
MKSVKTITSPEAMKLLGDETRRKIVFFLRAKEMTVSKIADELNVTPQAVYHHIKKLVETELVEVTREVRVDHLIESYYRATAEVFHFVVGEVTGGKEAIKEQIATALDALKKLGFKIQYDDKVVSELAGLQTELNECCNVAKYEEAVSELKDVDFITKLSIQEYAGMLSMSNAERARQEKIKRKFEDLLISLLKK